MIRFNLDWLHRAVFGKPADEVDFLPERWVNVTYLTKDIRDLEFDTLPAFLDYLPSILQDAKARFDELSPGQGDAWCLTVKDPDGSKKDILCCDVFPRFQWKKIQPKLREIILSELGQRVAKLKAEWNDICRFTGGEDLKK